MTTMTTTTATTASGNDDATRGDCPRRPPPRARTAPGTPKAAAGSVWRAAVLVGVVAGQAHAGGPKAAVASEHIVTAVVAPAPGVVVVAGSLKRGHATVSTWAQRSLDGGRTWTPALTPPVAAHSVVALHAAEGRLVALTQQRVEGHGELLLLQSEDAGASWFATAVVPRPAPDAEALRMEWVDRGAGSVTVAWRPDAEHCLEASVRTDDTGWTWTIDEARTCAAAPPPTTTTCAAGAAGDAWSFATCPVALEQAVLTRSADDAVTTQRVVAVDAGATYALLRAGAEVTEAASRQALRLTRATMARVERAPEGSWRAFVGADAGLPACVPDEDRAPFTATLLVSPKAFAPVVAATVEVRHDDGSHLWLEPGAPLVVDAKGAVHHRFASGILDVALPRGAVRPADRFVVEGPVRPDAQRAYPANARRSSVGTWGASTVLGTAVPGSPPHGGLFAPGAWDGVGLDETQGRGWVVDGCATAAVHLGPDFALTGSMGLGLRGAGMQPSLVAGSRVTTAEGAVIGTMTRALFEPSGAKPVVGKPSPAAPSPAEVSSGDGWRCGPLAEGWIRKANGSPWDVCWTPPEDGSGARSRR